MDGLPNGLEAPGLQTKARRKPDASQTQEGGKTPPMLETDATQQVLEPPIDTSTEPLEIPPESRWPVVVGTISIVLGAIGILCYGCQSVLNPVIL